MWQPCGAGGVLACAGCRSNALGTRHARAICPACLARPTRRPARPHAQVMYDASGVRLHAGKQASVLNMIITELPPDHPVSNSAGTLKDTLGHTPLQVGVGGGWGVGGGVGGCVCGGGGARRLVGACGCVHMPTRADVCTSVCVCMRGCAVGTGTCSIVLATSAPSLDDRWQWARWWACSQGTWWRCCTFDDNEGAGCRALALLSFRPAGGQRGVHSCGAHGAARHTCCCLLRTSPWSCCATFAPRRVCGHRAAGPSAVHSRPTPVCLVALPSSSGAPRLSCPRLSFN